MSIPKRIVFVGGGSGGHLAPLIPVMQAVHEQDPQAELHYVGRTADVESALISGVSFPLIRHRVAAGKFNRFLTLKHVPEFGRFVQGLFQAWKLIGRLNPDSIFSKGGFVSVPVALIGFAYGIPVYTHETDVAPGLANRIVSQVARKVFVSYPAEAYRGVLPMQKLVYCGQPIRKEFLLPDHGAPLVIGGREVSRDMPLIVVIGGSHGARQLNRLVQGAWEDLLRHAQIVHAVGSLDYAQADKEAATLDPALRGRLWVLASIGDELPLIFKRSCIAVSRAGGTLFELAATHTPTILVPLSTAAQNHQAKNASFILGRGAAMAFDERAARPDGLARMILDLLDNEFRRHALAEAIAMLSRPQAAAEMASVLLHS